MGLSCWEEGGGAISTEVGSVGHGEGHTEASIGEKVYIHAHVHDVQHSSLSVLSRQNKF